MSEGDSAWERLINSLIDYAKKDPKRRQQFADAIFGKPKEKHLPIHLLDVIDLHLFYL